MGILQNPTHRVQVIVKKEGEDKYGTTAVVHRTVDVSGTMQIAGNGFSTDEVNDLRNQINSTYRFICKEWPGGPHSEVFVLKGPPGTTGRYFSQHGDTRGYGTGSERVHRQEVTLMVSGAEVK